MPTTVIKKPNPVNEKNKTTLEELEEEVRRYVTHIPYNNNSY